MTQFLRKIFKPTLNIAILLVFIVIIAGSVVRMTGSGMGCPDWPKCFGYYIPPTEASQLDWKPNHEYKKGQVIIVDEALYIATSDFKSGEAYNETNWEAYTKHDYAIFNAWHTWIEYINRLLGALAGLATLALLIASFSFWKKNKSITLLSLFTVFAMGFQAWLGKTVVDSNLAPFKITIHMVMAFIIVAVLLYLVFKTKPYIRVVAPSKKFNSILLITLALTHLQIVLGTQVRQFVDEQIKLLGEVFSIVDIDAPLNFYVHRSFSILVLLSYAYIGFLAFKEKLQFSKLRWLYSFVALEIITGIAMSYFEFPFGTQTAHLVLASILFGVHFYIILEANHKYNDIQS